MLEFVPDPYSRERFLEAAMFLDRQTLTEKIGAEDFERAFEHLAPTGLSRDVVNKLKPWGVLLNLRSPRRAEHVALDAQLRARARRRRCTRSRASRSRSSLSTSSRWSRRSRPQAQPRTSRRARACRAHSGSVPARDLAAIWRLREHFIARHPEVAAHQDAMTKRVVHDRSVVMAFRMQRELRRGGAFIALGALHLYGEKGVLALLEADGYRADAVF